MSFKTKLGLCAAFALALSLRAENKIPADCNVGGFALGCQAYTFRSGSALEAVEKTAEVGGKVIEFYAGQKLSKDDPTPFGHDSPPEAIQKVKEKLAASGIRAVNYGVVDIPKDEARARKIFEFAKTMGLYAVTTESVDSIDTIEKMVKEYDIRVGFHDHPKHAGYRMWDPNYVLSVVKDRDPRIGSCADVGHWVRSGLRPVDCLRILNGRVISSHLKDMNEESPRAHDVPFGTGVSDIPGILEELKAQGFEGNISIEYEHDSPSLLPEVSQCVGFVRGYGTARKW